MASEGSADPPATATFVYPATGLRRKLKLKDATPKRLKQTLKLPRYPDELVDTDGVSVFVDGEGKDCLFTDLVPDGEYKVQVEDVVDTAEVTSDKPPAAKPKNLEPSDIQRALVCCQAVYENTPEAVQEFLKTELTSHDFVNVSVSRYGSVTYIIAETEDKEEVFIAVRGTSKFQDVMTGLSIWQQLASRGADGREAALGGRCHAGFLDLASTIPVNPFLQKYQQSRIVLCGHSLGGAVAHIVALNMLVELKRRGLSTHKVKSIAFGAPFFGDEDLRSWVEREDLPDCLLTVVNQKDPVPRILRLAEAVQSAVTTLSSVSTKVTNFVTAVRPLLTRLIGTLPSTGIAATAAAAAGTVVDQLPAAMNKLDGMMRKHNVTLQELNSLYRPVGWYMFIRSSLALGARVLPFNWEVGYVREEAEINGHLISDGEKLTWEKIHEHKVVCYATAFYNVTARQDYDKCLKRSNVVYVDPLVKPQTPEKVPVPRTVSMETVFPLRVDKVSLVSVVSQREDTDCGKLSVIIDGENLDFFVTMEEPFTGIPHDTKREVTVSSKSSRQVRLECQLTDGEFDPFPTITVRNHFEEVRHQTTEGDVTQMVGCTFGQLAVGELKPELLIRATQRCLATMMMMPESDRRRELGRDDVMKYLDKLDRNRRAVRNGKSTPQLFNMVDGALSVGLGELKDTRLLPVTTEIASEVGDHLKLTYPLSQKAWILSTLLGLSAMAGVVFTGGVGVAYGAVYIGAISISLTGGKAIAGGVAGVLAAGGSLYGRELLQQYFTNVAKNYTGVLRTLLEELRSVTDVEKENEIQKQAQKNDVYSLESLLMTKYEMLGYLDENTDSILKSKPFQSSRGKKKLRKAQVGSQKEALLRCQMTCDLFRIRQLLMKSCFVGLIGPQDAGKTTLIKMLWALENVTGIGFQKHTRTAVVYKATERMMIVDFPGTTMVDNQVATLVNHCGGLASFFILVMPFTGDPSKIDIGHLEEVRRFGCSFLVCISQCGRYLEDAFVTKEHTDKFRADFIKVLKVRPSDLLLIDSLKCTPEMRAVGLGGIDDVRLWIKNWLVKYDVFEKDDPELIKAVNEQAAMKYTDS